MQMRPRSAGVLLSILLSIQVTSLLAAAEPPPPPGMRVLERRDLPGGLRREKLILSGFDPDEGVPGIAVFPAEGGPFPLVIALHSFRGSKENMGGWCGRLAGRGLFALAIDAHLHGERTIAGLFRGENMPSLGEEYSIYVHQASIARTVKDVSAILDVLSRHADVDVSRAAVTGVSMGGSAAMALAWREPRIRTVASIVGAVDFWWDVTKIPPGPDQEARKAGYGPRLRELVNSIDPLGHFREIPPKALLLANGEKDEFISPESIRKFARGLEPLYGEARDRLRVLIVPEVGHGVTEAMWAAAEEWIVRHAKGDPDLPPPPISWAHVVVDSSAPRDPHCKAAGDMNGDGKMDLLVGSDGGDGLLWYEGPGWIKHRIDGGSFSTSMTIGDIDGDGYLDAIAPASGRGRAPVFWYKNPLPGGNPAADRWEKNPIGVPRGHHDVLAADLDGDRRMDVVLRGQSSFDEMAGDAVSLFRQEAGGRWSPGEVPCPHGEGIALADIDGDRRPDIIVNGRWYANPGGDILKGDWKERVFTKTWTHPDAKVAAGDIDGDGKAEIVLAPSELSGQRGRISWFRRGADPNAEWTEHVVADDVECVHHSLALADMDRDGALDIVTARMHQGKPPQEVAVYFNRGRETGWSKQIVATSGSHNIVVVDIDGDGRPDIYGANWNTGAPNGAVIEYWRNGGSAR